MRNLDTTSPADSAWMRFRLAFAGSTALRVLLDELDVAAPGYLADLRDRIAAAVIHGDNWSEDYSGEEGWDGFVPLQAPLGGAGVTFMPHEIAAELESQLFPAGATDADHLWILRSAVVLSLHAALEAFAAAHGFGRGSLPDFFRNRIPEFPADIDTPLRELDSTRHLFAHAGGVVDEAFQKHSPPPRELLLGERRPLFASSLERFARAAWYAALLLRQVQRPAA